MPVFLKNVRNNLLEFPRDPRSYPKLPVRQIESRATPDLKSLMFKSIVIGDTDNYANYIQFFKIEFSEEKSNEFSVPMKSEGRLLYYKKPSVTKNPVFLRCSCPDFQHRWTYPLHNNDGLLGKPIPYPSYPTGRPVNPKQLMGFCKHIYSMLTSLKDSDFVTE